jgi:DNA-binding GntR family transcriptional regulator
MAASIRYFPVTQPADLAGLRLLIELPALRRLADRGLSDVELRRITKLAEATTRAARTGRPLDYSRADMAFHLCLLELTGGPGLSDLGRLLLTPEPARAPGGRESLIGRDAMEHAELVGMIADGMASAADRLLRQHLSRLADAHGSRR